MPQPTGNKHVEVTPDWCQPLEIDFVIILQQQAEVLPRREGIAGQIEEGVKRLRAANIEVIALQRQPEHADNPANPRQH